MVIDSINKLAVYFNGEDYSINRTDPLPFPVIVLLDLSGNILAVIKFSYRNRVWHIENVVANKGYGPIIYRILMQLSGDNGLAPTYKKREQIKDLIVEKSKNIWSVFYNNDEINCSPIENYYDDSFLNNKFIVESNKLDIQVALNNFDELVDKEFNASFRQEILQKLKDLVIKYPEKKRSESKKIFTNQYTYELHAKAKTFLDKSVTVHQK